MNKQTAVYWFRNDLRLSDNKALTHACQQSAALVLVYCLAPDERTDWDFARVGQHRKSYLADTLLCLAKQCETLGSQLFVVAGDPKEQLPAILRLLDSNLLYCEEIAAPEEISQIDSLRAQGVQVHSNWQSSLFFPKQLPFTPDELPLVFTTFRKQLEQTGNLPLLPLPTIQQLPPVPQHAQQIRHIARPSGASSASEQAKERVAEKHTEQSNSQLNQLATALQAWAGEPQVDTRSAYPYRLAKAQGGEISAIRHLKAYFEAGLADHYKETRNGLIGFDYSTKLSPWLAQGAVSARQVYQNLTLHEAAHGANDSTYWIWFELLWRDYFRFLHLRFGKQLYQATGLLDHPFASPPTRNQRATSAKYASSYGPAAQHQPELFDKWCQGNTGQPLIDAGMRELAATGYLSNRMRQIVASYLIHNLHCDWRAGAAWFEAQLVDYDVYSNQGNWLYLAGYGTDPRTDRRFNLDKQQKSYDPNHSYTQLWLS
ncbi:MAG: DASH family cryptochrome [Gammaproteobacteria bacterium]|nr:DASH family cryptochrome [Gammaproteobacteria bacterium]